MKTKIRRQLAARNRRIQNRLDKTRFGRDCPVIAASNLHYEIADRTQAIAAGGNRDDSSNGQAIGTGSTDQPRAQHLQDLCPYAKSDHVLNIAYNLFAEERVWIIWSFAVKMKSI